MKTKTTLLVAMFAVSVSVHAEVYSGTCGSKLTWSLNTEDSTLFIEGSGIMDDNRPWARYKSNITYISLPNGLTSIGNSAFYSCENIRSIDIPEGVLAISEQAFAACNNLSSVNLPTSLLSIGKRAFSGCRKLASVTIPEGVQTIEYAAFGGCDILAAISIPSTVTSLSTGAFSGSKNLESITVSDGNTQYSSSDGVLYNKNKTKLYRCPQGKQGECTITDGVTHIDNSAFYECYKVTSIEIPNSVKEIGTSAFAYTSITTITIPDKVTVLSYDLFRGCSKLEIVHIGSGVTTIHGDSFSGCTAVKQITLSDNVATVEPTAFLDCKNLETPVYNATFFIRMSANHNGLYTIPDGITTILDYAFSECKGVSEVVLPNSISLIGTNAFLNCSDLQTMTIPETITELRDATFAGCHSLAHITLPNSLQIIGDGAFSECYALNELTIPENVYAIGVSAFSTSGISTVYWNAIACNCVLSYDGCTKNYPFPLHDLSDRLERLIFGDKVQYIPEQMCYDQHMLQSIKLPESVTHIGEFAFAYCEMLDTINIPAGVVEIGRDAFDGCPAMKAVNVDQDNEVYASVDGVLFNKDATHLIYFPGGRDGEYTIPDGTKTIGQMAFNKNHLSSVIVPECVDSLLMYSFAFSQTLQEIHFLSATSPYIEMYAFDNDYWSYYNPYTYFVPCGAQQAYQQAIDEAMQYSPQHVTQIIDDCDYVVVADFHTDYKQINDENVVTFYNDSYVAIRDPLTFELTPTDMTFTWWFWSFGDGSEICYEDNPTHIYPSYGGEFYAILHVYFDNDLHAAANHVIEIAPISSNPTSTENNNSVINDPNMSIRDGQLFIIRDGKMYNVQGLEVK